MSSVRFFTLAIVLVSAALSVATAADPTAADEAWGRPARGVAARLRVAKPAAVVGEPLAFSLLVRNPGAVAVRLPGKGDHLGWRLQFTSADGTRHEYVYQANALSPDLVVPPGGVVTIDLPVMQPPHDGRFHPVPDLRELPAGPYAVRAFAPFYESADEMPKQPLALALDGDDRPGFVISSTVDVRINAAGDAAGWTSVGDAAWQQAYRGLAGDEEEFVGELIGLPRPAPGEMSTLMRGHGYRLGDRLIAGRQPALEPLIGRRVRLRGKRVDMQLEGADLREIAPAAVRPAE